MSRANQKVGLNVSNLVAGYGATIVLDGISLKVPAGGTLAILGRNGVGKTTFLATMMGLTTRHSGDVRLGDVALEHEPTHRRVLKGLCYVPQEREIFPSLTTEENLLVAQLPGGWSLEAVFELFPRLAERRKNPGNRLSGGEQQMLAVGRALVGAPKVLLLDEPMEGLAPVVVEALFDALAKVRDESGVTIVLVEQKVDLALAFARDAVILDRGKIVYQGTCEQLKHDEAAQARFLGVGAEGEGHGV
jgi:branched-chain amino acid transport system ATP-binding protein